MAIIIILFSLLTNPPIQAMNELEYARISNYLESGQLPTVNETAEGYTKRSNWTRQAKNFELRNDKLYRDDKPVLREKDQEQAFIEHHCCNSAGKTFKTISDKYYYRGHKTWVE